MKLEVEEQIKAKRKQERQGVKSTTVTYTDNSGKKVEKNVSASEMNRLRLEYARKLDEERYKDERTEPLSAQEHKED